MARTWKDNRYEFSNKAERERQKKQKKRLKESRKIQKANERKTYAEEQLGDY